MSHEESMQQVQVICPRRVSNNPVSATSGMSVSLIVEVMANAIDTYRSRSWPPRRAVPWTAEGFKGRLQELVPAMTGLSEDDLEKLIGIEESDQSEDE